MTHSLLDELKSKNIKFSHYQDKIYLEKTSINSQIVKRYLQNRENSLYLITVDNTEFYEIPNQYIPYMLKGIEVVERQVNKFNT